MNGCLRVVMARCLAATILAMPASHAVAAAAKKPPASPAPAAAAPAQKPAGGVPLLPGGGSKEPVSINAGKLDYYDKEQKLIYTGDVVVVQGDSTMKASVLTIFLEKTAPAPGTAGAAAAPPAPAASGVGPGQGSSVRHMDAVGPVTLISKDQVGTGDSATYDKGEDKVYLYGNVTLSQGTNVTQGDRLIYDMATGQAQVFSGQTNGGRVMSVFTPGSGPPGGPAKPAAAPKAAAAPNGTANKRKAASGHAPRGEDAAARGEDVETQ